MHRTQVEKLYDPITSSYFGSGIINVFIFLCHHILVVWLGKLLKPLNLTSFNCQMDNTEFSGKLYILSKIADLIPYHKDWYTVNIP